MKRDLLTDAVRRTAGELGYAFHTGPDRLIPAKVAALPAVWLSPTTLTNHEGRNECRDTYHINLYLIAAFAATTRESAEPVLAVLEADAGELCHRLACNEGILLTYGLKCSPVLSAFTKEGEIALSAEMYAVINYCR